MENFKPICLVIVLRFNGSLCSCPVDGNGFDSIKLEEFFVSFTTTTLGVYKGRGFN